MRWLADAGYPSAAPVPGKDGKALRSVNGRPAAIATFLTGMSAARPSAAQCKEAGMGLAWLHESQPKPEDFERLPSGEWQVKTDQGLRPQSAALTARAEAIARLAAASAAILSIANAINFISSSAS